MVSRTVSMMYVDFNNCPRLHLGNIEKNNSPLLGVLLP